MTGPIAVAAALAFTFVGAGPSASATASQSAGPCPQHATAPGANSPGVYLHVMVSGARRVAGSIAFTLYGGDASLFLKPHGSIALTRIPLHGTGAEACFVLSAPGIAAVAVFHDENDNHHFDRNFLGLPAEGYGFSNDAPTVFGPPSFESARVTLHAGDNTVVIRLRY